MYPCTQCGRPADLVTGCPFCGAPPPPLAVEIERLNRDIAEMNSKDLSLINDRAVISRKLQAAMHQRALLISAQNQRLRQSSKQRATRRMTTLLPGSGTRPPRRTAPRQAIPVDVPVEVPVEVAMPPREPGYVLAEPGVPVEDARVIEAELGEPPLVGDDAGLRPEASSRSVQNVMLGLGALLLAVSAAVAAYYLTELEPVSRASILLVACAGILMVPPLLVRRRLTATAETVTVVGLLLLPLAGYAVRQIEGVRALVPTSGAFYAGLVFAGSALVALGYHLATRLTVPRYGALLAGQAAVPLLAFDFVAGPASWALVFAVLAGADMAVAQAVSRTEPTGAVLPSADWLRQLAWILHGAASAVALTLGTIGLATADSVGAAARSAVTLLTAAAVALIGAYALRRWPLPAVAAGLMTLAVIGSAARVATAALPGRALVLIAGAVALAGAGVRGLPATARRGPQLAASGALAVLGFFVAAAALRAAVAPIRAVLPVWEADLRRYPEQLAAAVGPASWQVAGSAALLTIAAALAVPIAFRREATVVGVAITALAAPAALAAPWSATPWLLLVAAVGLGATGLTAETPRAARTHVGAALTVGLAAAATSLAEPQLTASVLTFLTLAGLVIGLAPRVILGGPYADVTGEAAKGGAAAALPGAAATATAAALPDAGQGPALAAGLLGVGAALCYAAIAQVALRRPSPALALGGTLSALVVAVAAFGADGATAADAAVALALLVGALLLWLAPSIDAGRRADRRLDGSDIAAAAITAGTVGALARLTSLVLPGAGIAIIAALVLLVAIAVRAMPEHWRPGPALGCGLAGGVVAAVAGYAAVVGGLRTLMAASPVWATDLSTWESTVLGARGYGVQTPIALLLLAAAASIALPVRSASVLSPVCIGLAVLAAPAALGLPWWSPIALGAGTAGALGLAAVATRVPQAGYARASVGAALAGHAVGASLVAAWATAGTLAGIGAVALLVAGTAAVVARVRVARPDSAGVGAANAHLVPIGGSALTTALLAVPGAVAAAAASMDHPMDVILPAALAASSIGLAVVALLRKYGSEYLGYASVGTVASATTVALIALAAGAPVGVYAAAAALLGVLVELLRASAPGREPPRSRLGLRLEGLSRRDSGAGVLTPGLLASAAVPTVLALVTIAPALAAVLVEPHRTVRHIWQGPDAAGADWLGGARGSDVLAALVLTCAFALAALGFGERATRLTRDEIITQVVPVVIPGIAITLLIAPAGLGFGWPVGTVAALTVFTIAMLGVALSPPPPDTLAARPLRFTRGLVLVIGLAAGGAGLAGSLAEEWLTLGTLAGAVCVGLTAALGGRTRAARILGWAFAAASAHMLVYVAGVAAGLPGYWSAFGVVGVAAIVLVTAATLPRLQRPEAYGEAPALEWSGYAGAVLGLALSSTSLPHLAALLAAWGAILGIAAVRPSRSPRQRRVLLWSAALFELAAWWLLMVIAEIALYEAYTLPFAALALVVGVIELRHHPELGSWGAYGVALAAAFVPTLAIVLVVPETPPARRIALLLAAVATLILGSMRRQQAPVVVGGLVTTIAALRELGNLNEWYVLIPLGVLLLVVGANYEKRRRDLQRLRGALTRMR